MKKMFLFAAFAGVALASCTTDEEIFAPVNQGNEIEFVAANYVHQTRTEHALNQPFSNVDFSVWAWLDGTDKAHMDKVKVTYDANGKACTVEGTYYWPDEALDFAAISPAADKRIAVNRTGGATTVTYTFKDEEGYRNNQTNLMHTDFVENQKQEGGTVALGFRHALAKLNVVVKQTQTVVDGNPENGNGTDVKGYKVIVNNLSIENFNCYGTYTVENNRQNLIENVWVNTTGDADWKIIDAARPLVKDIDIFEDDTYSATYEGNGYVMPQLIPADAKVIIDYDVVTVFKSGATSTKNYKSKKALNEIVKSDKNPITHWYTNKNITYTFTINPKYVLSEIKFTATEEEWGTQDGAHTF